MGVQITTTLQGAKPSGVSIADQEIVYRPGTYLAGQVIPVGFDAYGYNYQAQMFKGYYINAYLNGDGLPPYEGDGDTYLAANPTVIWHWAWAYRDDYLEMKWNDAWLSNMDCDGDGLLDRHYGYPTYRGSGAWLTNHQNGESEGEPGEFYKWSSFVKIVAAPVDAVLMTLSGPDQYGNFWYTADGRQMGVQIWGEFALIFVNDNSQNNEYQNNNTMDFHSPAGPGVGKY